MATSSIDPKAKSAASQETLIELRKRIIENFSNVTSLTIEGKLSEIFNPNTEKYEEVKNRFLDELFEGITTFSWEYEDKLLNEVTILIESINFDDLINSIKAELVILYPSSTELELLEKAKFIINSLKEDLSYEIKKYISENTPSYAETMLLDGTKSLYAKPDMVIVRNDSVKSIEKLLIKINDILAFSLNIFTELNRRGSDKIDEILDKIRTALDIRKLDFTNKVVNWTVEKMTHFVYRMNEKIGEVFLPPRVTLDESGYHITLGVDLGELRIGNSTLGNIGSTIDRIRGTAALLKANSSLERLKAEANSRNMSQTNVPTKTNASTDENKSSEEKKKDKEKSVKERKTEKPETDKKDPEKPKEETYDNSIPPRATVKQDPRRNSQELVLWEGKGGGYVLLRNKSGSYLVLDEGGTVRLQSSGGSYIQLGNNGNIDIEASGNVRLNCSGASYAKQF